MSGFAESLYFRSPHWLQNLMVSAYGYQLYRKRYTGIFEDIMVEIRAIEEMNANQVEALQAERLHRMMAYCEQNIPYYQKLLSDHGFTALDFTQTAHIKKLPVLKKATVKNHPDWFRPKNGHKAWMLQHTSGSTGTPLSLDVDEYTYKLAMALLVRHEENAGVPFRAPRATFAGRMVQPVNQNTPPFSRLNKAENQRMFSSYHLSEKTFPYYRKELDHFNPVEIIGYPSAISLLAKLYESTNIQPDFQLKAVVTNSETLLDWQREAIERTFNCQVYDYYGTAEYVIFASQNSEGIYKTSPLIGLTEVLPDDEQTPEHGSVIATTLCNQSMPLIRYEVGDTAQIAYDATTPDSSPAIQRFLGRIDDYISTPDGRKIGRLDHIFKGAQGIREAQIVQESKASCVIKIAVNQPERFDEITIVNNLRNRVGNEIEVRVDYVDSIPKGKNGKFKAVVGIE
jgi:phenylacetate-CoA ligase